MRLVRGALWVCVLRGQPGPEEPHGYGICEAQEGHEGALAAAMNVDEAVVRERLQRGSRAFLAWSCGQVAGWTWVSTGREWAPPLRRTLRFRPDECYSWDGGVRERHRGNGLLTALLETIGREMAAEGHSFMWGGILDRNHASRRSCIAAGFRPVLRVQAVHVGRWVWVHRRPVEYADPGLVDRARRLLGG